MVNKGRKFYMSKKVCSLASKLWSVICSQNSLNSALVIEFDVIPLRRANASNNSLANSFESFIPDRNKTDKINDRNMRKICIVLEKYFVLITYTLAEAGFGEGAVDG